MADYNDVPEGIELWNPTLSGPSLHSAPYQRNRYIYNVSGARLPRIAIETRKIGNVPVKRSRLAHSAF